MFVIFFLVIWKQCSAQYYPPPPSGSVPIPGAAYSLPPGYPAGVPAYVAPDDDDYAPDPAPYSPANPGYPPAGPYAPANPGYPPASPYAPANSGYPPASPYSPANPGYPPAAPYRPPPIYPPPEYPPANTYYPPQVPYPSNAYYNYSTNYSIANGPKVLIGYLIRVSSPTIINATRGVFPNYGYAPPPPVYGGPPPQPPGYTIPVHLPARRKYKRRRPRPPAAGKPAVQPAPLKPALTYYDPDDSAPWPSFPSGKYNPAAGSYADGPVDPEPYSGAPEGPDAGGNDQYQPVPMEDYKKVAQPYNYYRSRT